MDALNCSVCYASYDKGHKQPLVLPCGHTFCSFCIKNFSGSCPTCRKGFSDEQIQKNYALCVLIEEIDHLPQQIKLATRMSGILEPLEDLCIAHKKKINRLCTACMELMCIGCKCPHSNQNTRGAPVHEGSKCAGCHVEPIVGNRYQCSLCPEFNYCEMCIGDNDHSHTCFKLISVNSSPSAKAKAIHPMVACDRCFQDPIVGNRYKCSACPNFDYCEGCIADYAHFHRCFKIMRPRDLPPNLAASLISDLDLREQLDDLLKPYEKLAARKEELFRNIDECTEKIIQDLKESVNQLKKQMNIPRDLRQLEKTKLKDCLNVYKQAKVQEKELQAFLKNKPVIVPVVTEIDSVSHKFRVSLELECGLQLVHCQSCQ